GKSRKRAYAEWTFHTLLWSSPGAFIRVYAALGAGGVLLRMCGCSEEELPDAEQMYWQIPEYDRLNKICIPLGRDGNGKTVYLRLPYGDFERYYGNLCTSFIEAFELEEEFIDGGVRWIKNIKRIGESELGGGHPITGTARNIAAIALGENPDDGIGRPIIDETVYKAGDVAGIAADTARYAYNNTIGSILGRVKPPVKAGEPEPAFLEKVLSMPGISAALGRWIAVSDKGLDQLARDAARKEEKTAAQRTLLRRELAEKAAAGTISDADFEPLAGGFTRGDKQALRAQLKKIEARKNGKMDSILINYPARAQQEAIRRQLNRIGAGHEEN
ncbi:MAG: hypothetical protein IJI37_02315, partial [Opitutales bacterium]|nr:hypothetical protein [Opitutales bacterium]